ncbi:MAG: hypothetical protein ACLQU4_08085, partial [Limisphaerales bacterium]
MTSAASLGLRLRLGLALGLPTKAGTVSWTPIFRPLVKFDFCRSAVDKKEQTYESKTEKTQCGLQGQ